MKIREKFILILLSVSLVPAIVIMMMTRISIKRLTDKISGGVVQKQIDDTVEGLQILVDNYHQMIGMSGNVILLTLGLQASEIELNLMTPLNDSANDDYTKPYGYDGAVADIYGSDAGSLSQSGIYPGKVDYQSLSYFLADGLEVAQAAEDLVRHESMTGAYHNICMLNYGKAVWHHTTFESGLHFRYPATVSDPIPGDYDPRTMKWYRDLKEGISNTAMVINFDPVTKLAVWTFSMPIYYPDGSFAGVTAIDMAMGTLIEGLRLPEFVENHAELFLTGFGRFDEQTQDMVDRYDDLVIYLHSSNIKNPNWTEQVSLPRLTSHDSNVYQEMVADITAGLSGSRVMEYDGSDALWVYSCIPGQNEVLHLIVPMDYLNQLAVRTKQHVVTENFRQVRNSSIVILIVIVVGIIISIKRAHRFTEPIKNLAVTANKLSLGDFSAAATVDTGDELEDLANVFNQVGPRLKQHQQLQHSLNLAGAIQKNLLPKKPPVMAKFDIAGHCLYCDETGGDYYDFVTFNNGDNLRAGLLLGDVTGHGIGAALLMTSARSIMRNLSPRLNDDLPELMRQFNNQLVDDTHDDKFMTMFYGILSDDDRSLVWSSGGHDPGIWYLSEEDDFKELNNTGP